MSQLIPVTCGIN